MRQEYLPTVQQLTCFDSSVKVLNLDFNDYMYFNTRIFIFLPFYFLKQISPGLIYLYFFSAAKLLKILSQTLSNQRSPQNNLKRA